MTRWDTAGVAFVLAVCAGLAILGGLRADPFVVVALVAGWLLGYATRVNYERAHR